MVKTVITAFGRQGDGKSSLLNSMLNKHDFVTTDDIQKGGKVTTETKVVSGNWLGDATKEEIIVIDNASVLNPKETYSVFLDVVQHFASGVNTFLFVFNLQRLGTPDQVFGTLVDILVILFGRDFWKHVGIVFTFCDGEGWQTRKQQVAAIFEKELTDRFRTDELEVKIPTFFVSNKTKEGFGELHDFIFSRQPFQCKFLEHLRKLEGNKKKEGRYLREQFKIAIDELLGVHIPAADEEELK